MANLAGADMTCWPSHKHLTDATCQDVKTVEAGLRRLKECGLISDTGQRRGSTGQVIVYRLNTPEIGGVQELPKTPVFPDNTPVFPVKDPQISGLTPPKTGDGTLKEPSRTPKEGETRDPLDSLSGIDPQILADYLQVRKAKKAGKFTATAIAGLQREAGRAGLSVEQAMQACCEFGWQGFNAGWYAERTAKAIARNGHTGETPYQRSMRLKMQEFLPGIAAKAPGSSRQFVETEAHDVTPRRVG